MNNEELLAEFDPIADGKCRHCGRIAEPNTHPSNQWHKQNCVWLTARNAPPVGGCQSPEIADTDRSLRISQELKSILNTAFVVNPNMTEQESDELSFREWLRLSEPAQRHAEGWWPILARAVAILAILLTPACSADPQGCPGTGEDLSGWTATYNAPSGPRTFNGCGFATLGPFAKDAPSYIGVRRTTPPGSLAELSACFQTTCIKAQVAVAILEGGKLEPALPVIMDIEAGTPLTLSVARPSPSGVVDYVINAVGDGCQTLVDGVVTKPRQKEARRRL